MKSHIQSVITNYCIITIEISCINVFIERIYAVYTNSTQSNTSLKKKMYKKTDQLENEI